MEHAQTDSRYWYGATEAGQRQRAVEVLQAFRLYRAAEVAMRRRTRDSMSMGENELLVQTADDVREPANRRGVITFE